MDDLTALKQQVNSLETQLQQMASVIAGLQSRLLTSNPSSNVDNPSAYAILPSQQVTQFSHVDLYNFVFTNQTGPGTSVSWSEGFLIYQGTTFPIAAGICANTTPFIYWIASNPFIFQSSATYPTLGVNDFIIGFNTVNTSSVSGFFELAQDIHNSVGDRVLITANSVSQYNHNNNICWALQRTSGLSNAGQWALGDGNGNIPFRITGLSNPAGAAPAGGPIDALNVIINGVSRQLALY